MKHYMDISRIKETEEDGMVMSNTGCFEIGDIIQISEKIDGANSSIALDENGNLIAFSRKNELRFDNNLRGFWNFIQSLDKNKFVDLGKRVLFGEWLVAHTVKYDTESYSKWYVYDIYDTETEQWLSQTEVKAFAESHGLEYIHVLYDGPFISWDHCRTFLNSPAYGDKQEGIVIKNQTKLNNPDVRNPFYLKIVNDSFMETKHSNHIRKLLDPEHQQEKQEADEAANMLVTKARVAKEINKMIDEGILPEQLTPKDMGIVARYIPKRIYDDVIKEESESAPILNKFFGKSVSNITMNLAREIILGN